MQHAAMAPVSKGPSAKKNSKFLRILRNYDLYLLLAPTLLYFAIFHYGPMYGIQIAFKEFMASRGITGSPWVGFDHFERFFKSYQFWTVIKNTVGISLYQLAVAFPIPIMLALLLNQLTSQRFKRLVQTVTYAPHFISTVVMVGMIFLFLSPRHGLINKAIVALGFEPIFFMGSPEWFKTVYVWSGIWQNAGWAMIIYLAALSAINPDLHEAAMMDGASKLRRIWHIDLPGILPTIMILLILDIGNLMSIGFEKVFLMQTPLNLDSSEIIATYVYKVGLLQVQYSYSAAIGLFNNVINFILLLTVNQLAKKLRQTSLW
jgi:putative aldouronate transport system permease protein